MNAQSSVPDSHAQPIRLSSDPLVTECPPAGLGEWLTPAHLHYVRHHFDTVHLDVAAWRLEVGGLVERPLSLSLENLQGMPYRTLAVTLECAGNGRSRYHPPAPGNQFTVGAISTAEWTGVPLVDVLEAAGVKPGANSVWFVGADRGPQGQNGVQPYSRGLTLDRAYRGHVLLAYRMNGEPLTAEHGAPVRLIVPGWYGMASVKWLTHIRVMDRPYDGYFQMDRYVYKIPGRSGHMPVSTIRVKSLITSPGMEERVRPGPVHVQGKAWAGERAVTQVEFSADAGQTWTLAEVELPRAAYAWQRWQMIWLPGTPGRYTLLSRAADSAGEVQPERAEWNEDGYGNNAWEPVEVLVIGGTE